MKPDGTQPVACAIGAPARDVLWDQEVTLERQRILADLHDGLGASLIGLLHLAQSGCTDGDLIERRVREALLEMRIAIDALRPHGNELETVLGNLRYRLDETIRGAGMRLEWRVAELPPVAGLTPSVVFSIQRIVLEAITNALKHSRAQILTITARVLDRREIRICIADDGLGFGASLTTTGVGVASMHARAQRIGARLDIRSGRGVGTTVCLVIPGLEV